MNAKIFQTLEFEKICQAVAHHVRTQAGKQQALEMRPSFDLDLVETWQYQTAEAVRLIQDNRLLPVPRLDDLSETLYRLALGASLNGREIASIGKLLESVMEVHQFLELCREDDIQLPYIQDIASQMVHHPLLVRLIQQSVEEDGSVRSSASEELSRIRRKLTHTEDQIRQQLNNMLKSKQQMLTDSIITIRNGRYVLPVKAEYRYQFGGNVHDQSSSGQTLYIEPQTVVNLNNQLSELQTAQRKEIERILLAITSELMPYHQDIESNDVAMGNLDFIQARGLYAQEIDATKPQIHPGQHVALWQARHPLIDAKKIVANDIIIGEAYRALIITGPNTGGKTILLKTLGLLQLMGQSGLHIPCDEGSQLGLFDDVFADIGDEQSIEQSLSTFSSHMTNIIDILEKMTDKSLLLFDELGSGTDPQEGAALAMAILNFISQSQAIVMATTHYPELKVYAHDAPQTINASMEFDSDTLSPTYRLLIGIPGRSNAFDISQRLGLFPEILQVARSGIDQESQSVNEMIAKLERQRRQANQDYDKAHQLLEDAGQLHKDLKHAYQQFISQKEQLIEKSKKEANEKVALTQAQAEKILQEIRDLQLEQGQQTTVKEHVLIDKKTQFDQLKQPEHLKKNKVLQKVKRQKAFNIGDDVEVLTYGQRGTIIEQQDANTYVVQMGILKMAIDKEDLSPLTKIKETKQVNVQRRAGSKVQTSLDLRGQRYDAAMDRTRQYIDQALLSNHPMVTIVHGKGTGALRQGIQDLLKAHSQVDRFEYAPPNAGGSGATIVYFK